MPVNSRINELEDEVESLKRKIDRAIGELE